MEKVIKLINNLSEIARLTDFIEDIGNGLNLTPDITMNINLALEEAIVNIIMYAYPSEEECEITLQVSTSNSQLIFLLTDCGISFDPTQTEEAAHIDLPIDERPIGGLGIFLIRKIMNEVSYERIGDKNKLTMKKNIL